MIFVSHRHKVIGAWMWLFLLTGLTPPGAGAPALGARQGVAAARPLAQEVAAPALPWYLAWLDWVAAPVQAAQAGIDWTSRTSAADNQWYSVTYGNGLFVAVAITGTGNRVMTSPDGITWTIRTSAADNAWNSVTYGNGLFVAVAGTGTGNRVMTSPNGIDWTIRTSTANISWRSVTYGNGLFVAVASTSDPNQVMTSPDGITWTARAAAADNFWYSVTYGNGRFVAVAGSGTGNRVMTSPDGITWTARTSAADNDWRSVTYGNGLFVAVAWSGTNNRVMTSPDGITWTLRTSAADNVWNSVTYGNGLFVAVACGVSAIACNVTAGNRVMTSPNGIDWTLRNTPANNNWRSVSYVHDLFVAVASSGTNNRVMTSGALACGPGLALTTSPTALWQQLALPCVPTTATVGTTLGANTAGQLNAAIYANAALNGWLMYGNDLPNNKNLLLGVGDPLTNGVGYWLKSFSAPVGGGNLTVTGTATPAPVTTTDGCASANGCAAIAVTTVAGANRYNLAGNPFPYNVDWARVRVRVKTSGGGLVGVYTPSQAAGVAGSGNANPPVLSNQISIYNGTQYDTWTDVSLPNPGNLKYFQSFWVLVYAAVAANNYTVELLIPAEQSTHSQLAPASDTRLAAARPWPLAWLDWLIPAAAAATDAEDFGAAQHPGTHPAEHPARQQPQATLPAAAAPPVRAKSVVRLNAQGLDPRREWYVRLLVDEPATGYQDHNSVLGQLLGAQNGYDPRDLSELPPFGKPYLTLVFTHPEWGPKAGDYASDFRRAQKLNAQGRPIPGRPAADWAVTLRADRPNTRVILRWEGAPAVLRNSQLLDPTARRPLRLKDYPDGYPLTLTTGSRTLTWRYLGQPGSLP